MLSPGLVTIILHSPILHILNITYISSSIVIWEERKLVGTLAIRAKPIGLPQMLMVVLALLAGNIESMKKHALLDELDVPVNDDKRMDYRWFNDRHLLVVLAVCIKLLGNSEHFAIYMLQGQKTQKL